jgi:PAS domain S-box-containing protein
MAEAAARPSAHPSESELLRKIVEGVEAETGDSFFRALVRHLAQALDVPYAFVSELTRGGTYFRSLALWARGRLGENFEIPLEGTPCEAVLKGEICFHPNRLQELFPADRGLVDWGVVSYGGVPMLDSSGRVVGHLAFFHTRPLEDEVRALSVMRIFARRTVAEIERQRAERALRDSEQRLACILDTANDAVLSFDSEGRLQLFNRAAERIFRRSAEAVLGTPVFRFTTDEARASLEASLRQLDGDPASQAFTGEAEGLLARRADGTLFPFEASVSRSEAAGRPLYTVILRDIEERKRRAQEHARLLRQNEYLREEIASVHNFEEIVGQSPAWRRVLDDVALVAGTDATVLITGETGTGKELVARAVHANSRRSGRPLVKVNCASLPPGLVESELFGHEKGAFTGATERRIGRFELAHGGTLFLDEIGELPADVQSKLLRALQERELERVGGSRTIRVDVRVIAATNRDLPQALEEGRFRSDLYYRLNVFPLTLPPLRERAEDVALLAHYFVNQHAPRIGRRVSGLAPAALERLLAYPWPGNVRELENVIERALILGRSAELDVPPELLGLPIAPPSPPAPRTPPAARTAASAAATLEEVERAHIVATLQGTGWRIEGPHGAARLLGLHPSTLRSRMEKLGVRRAGAAPS